MDFISDESICAAFEDLIVNFDAEDVPSIRYTERDVESVDVHFVPKQNAFAMSLTDLMPELERRSLPVKGFFSDDAKTLQVAFDREHDSYVEAKKKELFDSQVIEAQAAAVSRKETLIKESIAAEESEVVGSARIMAWFQMIQDKVSPVHCRIEELTDVSARSLSKLLWSDSNLVSLDVSNMSLSDDSGAFLARALRKNTCLKKLDLGGNQFGSKCCLQLAKSLLANPSSALAFLSLESNPLCTGNDSKESIGLLVNAIGKNTSLVSLSLWRCGLGIEAGMMLAQEIERGNSRLISLEVGYNHFNSLDVVRISEKLKDNRKEHAARLTNEAALAEKQGREIKRKIQEDNAKQKEVDTAKWLADEEKARAEARRLEAEENKRVQEKIAQKEKALVRAQKMEDARVQELNKKKAKGKKGKGKKR